MIVHCPACSKTMTLPDSASGKTYRCPHCQERLAVPSPVLASEDDDSPIIRSDGPKASKHRRPNGSKTRLLIVLGLLVVIAGVGIPWAILGWQGVSDRAEKTSRESRRKELARECLKVMDQIRAREKELGRDGPLIGLETDPELIRLNSKLNNMDAELNRLEEKR